MTEAASRLIEQALTLSDVERVDVIEAINLSLWDYYDKVDKSWDEVIARQIKEFESGNVITYDEDEVFAEIDREDTSEESEGESFNDRSR